MDVERLSDRLNAPVQGTAADGLKLALALLWVQQKVFSANFALTGFSEVRIGLATR
jgi:hypothetical protein